MNDLIKRLEEITAKKNCAATTKATIAEAIEVINSKGVPAVQEGTWIVQKDSMATIVTCSSCKSRTNDAAWANFPYCPICGSKNL